jgi:energy-coupling factor transport system substrate-specific component
MGLSSRAARSIKGWVARQFTTRVIVLMPVAIAINIVLGYTVQSGLKLPIYVDSIGTILVGVLAGPIPGLVTGALSNLIWQYAPGIGSGSQIGPFAITAAAIGFLAGIWGQLGLFRPRRGRALNYVGAVIAVGLIAVMAFYTYSRAYASTDAFNSNVFGNASISIDLSRLIFFAIMVVFLAIVGWALFLRRDIGVVYAISAGLATGIVAALISAPIYAFFYGGLSGSGTDAIVAAFRAGGDSLYQSTLKQGLLSDPIDKMITTFVVFFILGSLSRRFVARFPNGPKLIAAESDADSDAEGDARNGAAGDASESSAASR